MRKHLAILACVLALVSAGLGQTGIVGVIRLGPVADRPACGSARMIWFVTDAGSERFTYCDGTSWRDVAPGLNGSGGIPPSQFEPFDTKTYHGRTSAGTGAPEHVAVATLKTDLGLVKGDVGLGNVDNTSDVSKPVSSAQQTALDGKLGTGTRLDQLQAPTDVTTLNASSTAHGLLPKLTNTGTKFLRDDGTYQTIAGGGDMLKSTYDPDTDGVIALAQLDGTVEQTGHKDAANGYAGLSAASKLAASQMTGVLASSDLTNDSALEKTANKNAASGYAGLNASSKLTGSQQVYGSAANTAAEGNDSRLSDARTPTGSAGGDLAGTYPNPTVKSSVALTTPNIGAATGTSLAVTGAVTSSGTAGIGYATGAGGTVTQATSKSTGVTINKLCGTITMNGAALAAATIVSFTVTNSTVAATDVVHVQHDTVGTIGAYTVMPNTSAAGSFRISVRNNSAGSLSEAIVLRFVVVKATTSKCLECEHLHAEAGLPGMEE